MLDYSRVPVAYMVDGVKNYLESGIPPGSFLAALFCNDLKEAFRRADEANTVAMRAWVRFMINEMPMPSQGSAERVEQWITAGGLRGLRSAGKPVG